MRGYVFIMRLHVKAKIRHWINQNPLLNLLLKAEIKSTVSTQNLLLKGEINGSQRNNTTTYRFLSFLYEIKTF